MEPEDPRLVAAARHALHDEEIVAAYAVDGDAADDAARARTFIERCVTCQELHADMVAIGSVFKEAGTAEAVGAVRPAPRDYRLSASDAVRLRGGNVLQRGAARLVDGIAAFGRPVGASLAAMGVVGLLVGSMSLGAIGLGGSPASMPIEANGATGAPAPGATAELTVGGDPKSSPTTDRSSESHESPDPREEFGTTNLDTGQGGSWTSLLFAGSIVLVIAGAALLLAGSRRRRHAPARNRAHP